MGIYILIQVTFYILFQVVNLDQLSQGFVTIGVTIIFGFLANDLLQLKLSKDGFELFAIVIEKNKEQAYRQFLNDFPIYSDELIK